MKYTVFVDGSEGTTGLKINERLASFNNIEILQIDSEKRKDIAERKKLLNSSDFAFLCLPDYASREAVSLIENDKTVVIDASTAFRTDETFAYAFPEIDKNLFAKITLSKLLAVPGCHATGFTSIVYPLIKSEILPKDYPICCQSVTGYSGGGKSLIAKYEQRIDKNTLKSPQFYALGLSHKHLPEMQKINSLLFKPLFTPIVADFYNGMCVAIPLHKRLLSKKADSKFMFDFFSNYYCEYKNINILPLDSEQFLEDGFLDATKCNNTNNIDIAIFQNDEQLLLLARLDNLGKGASGAAVQAMELKMKG